MILLVSTTLSDSTDVLVEIFNCRHLPVFRLNLDVFYKYNFLWEDDEFQITDPTGRLCRSTEITVMAFYKGVIAPWFTFVQKRYACEREWLISWLNRLYECLACYGAERNLIHLWRPHGFGCAKTLQMKIAKKYFKVPDFKLHWGMSLDSHKVIVKPLTQRPLACGEMVYAKILDRADLDPHWPWFTQEIADGDRDATVLYVNGRIYCYKFASVRGNMVDWRITQGTEANQWVQWNAGTEFKEKVKLYMQEMKLKYGRLDFIIGGKEIQFLEVNSEGQFGWLDSDKSMPLHNDVADALLDPASIIND